MPSLISLLEEKTRFHAYNTIIAQKWYSLFLDECLCSIIWALKFESNLVSKVQMCKKAKRILRQECLKLTDVDRAAERKVSANNITLKKAKEIDFGVCTFLGSLLGTSPLRVCSIHHFII